MKRYATFLVIFSLVFFSCKKETHVTEVTEVTQVINNAKGIRFLIKPTDWFTDEQEQVYTVEMPVSEVDAGILDHGLVATYISFDGETFEALPEVFSGIAFGTYHTEGSVFVDYHALDGSQLNPLSTDLDVKIVLIPAEVAKAHPGVDLKNFSQVKSVFLKNQKTF